MMALRRSVSLKSITLSFAILLLLLITLTALTAATAQAAKPGMIFCEEAIEGKIGGVETNLSVDLAVQEVLGRTVTAYAVLTDREGSPIVAAPINFYVGSKASPPVWVGHAVTDCDGVAIIRFEHDGAGALQITAKLDESNRLKPNQVTATIELKRIAEESAGGVWSLGMGGATFLVGTVVAIAIFGAAYAAYADKYNVKSE